MLNERIRYLMLADKLVAVPPQASVFEVACSMRERLFGAVVVVDSGALLGIFTEQDAVFRVIAQDRDARQVPVGDVMSAPAVTIGPDASLGQALLTMQEGGFRYLPVVENDRAIGILRAHDALDPALDEFVCEMRRRDSFR
jgi:CBS domain-containing protein